MTFYGIESYAQRDRVKLGSKEETKKDRNNSKKSGFIKLYPFNLLRGDLSLGFEKALSRSFSIEPIICMTFKNPTEIRLNSESDFAEQTYFGTLTFNYPDYQFVPAFGFKGTLKLFPQQHDDLEGDYYAIGYGHKQYAMRQHVDFGNGIRTTKIEDIEYKFMRGTNIMNRKNFNFELGIGTGLRNIKFINEAMETVYDAQTNQTSKELVRSKINYYSPILLIYFNLGINIL